MYEYTGNLHIHSKYSDGSKSINEIAAIAQNIGLDFIIITDHFNLKGLAEEGYKENVLVLVGMEINDTCNHYLALDIAEVVANNTQNPQKVIDDVNCQGGIGIIAHPIEKGTPYFNNSQSYEWTDWDVQGFQGIEIWNYLSQYKGSFTSIPRSLYLLCYPHAGLTGPFEKTMEIYDQRQKNGENVVAFGGSDAHGIVIKLGPVKIPIDPYELSLRCINMHILSDKKLTGDLLTDKKIVLSALRKGRTWIAYDYFIKSTGFKFELRSSNQTWPIGSRAKYQPNLCIKIKTPIKATIKLIKNGKLWQKSQGKTHTFTGISKGIYRAEAFHKHFLKLRPWIITNSIQVE